MWLREATRRGFSKLQVCWVNCRQRPRRSWRTRCSCSRSLLCAIATVGRAAFMLQPQPHLFTPASCAAAHVGWRMPSVALMPGVRAQWRAQGASSLMVTRPCMSMLKTVTVTTRGVQRADEAPAAALATRRGRQEGGPPDRGRRALYAAPGRPVATRAAGHPADGTRHRLIAGNEAKYRSRRVCSATS